MPDPYNQVNLLWQSSEYGQQGGVRQSALDAVAPGAPRERPGDRRGALGL